MTNKEQMDRLLSNLPSIKEKIGFDFYGKDNLLIQAFTHSSFAMENTNFADNEHLEFFGDSFLNSYVTSRLFKDFCRFYDDNQLYCEKTVGELSKIRANNVCTENLANCIDALGFQNFILLGRGSENIREESSIKENLCEAIIGAVYAASNKNIEKTYKPCSILLAISNFNENYIEIVDEWCKEHEIRYSFQHLLSYYNQSEYKVRLSVYFQTGLKTYDGIGKSKIEAQLKASEMASEEFNLIDMQTFLPASKITEEESVKLLNQLYSKFDYAFDEPEFQYPKEPDYDNDGNPYWYCLCRVYQKEEKGGGYSKKEAKRRAAFKMLANLLDYKIKEDYDDGL